MMKGKLTQEAIRDLLRADRIALEQGSCRVCPEHLLLAYAEAQTDLWYQGSDVLSRCLSVSCADPKRRPRPRSLSRALCRIVNRAEAGGKITSDALLASLLAENGLRRRLRSAGADPEMLFSQIDLQNR